MNNVYFHDKVIDVLLIERTHFMGRQNQEISYNFMQIIKWCNLNRDYTTHLIIIRTSF